MAISGTLRPCRFTVNLENKKEHTFLSTSRRKFPFFEPLFNGLHVATQNLVLSLFKSIIIILWLPLTTLSNVLK